MKTLSKLAGELKVDEETLEREAAKALLLHKLKLVESEIASILSKYNASSYEELLRKVENGEVEEHPAWEDLIVLENLMDFKKKILRLMEELRLD